MSMRRMGPWTRGSVGWREEDERGGVVGELGGLGWTFSEDEAQIKCIIIRCGVRAALVS